MSKLIFQFGLTRDFLNEKGEIAYGDIGLDLLNESPFIEYRFLDEYSEVVTPDQIKDLDGISIIYPFITRETFSQGANRLIVIGRFGAGYDRVDTKACTDAKVALINAADVMSYPTASAALMYILVLAKRLPEMDRIVREGRWDLRGNLKNIEPKGKTLGIIGLGKIGAELTRLVKPMDMRIICYDPYVNEERALSLGVRMVSLETLLREADFVSIHCLLTDETYALISDRELAMMKPSAYLINMARGPVVDHKALIDALTERRIAGAGLDVFNQEPLPVDDPLTKLDNVVLSPHWAAVTSNVYYEIGMTIMKGILMVARGELPDSIVNTEVIDKEGFQEKLTRFKGP